jgi:hypothetical protein
MSGTGKTKCTICALTFARSSDLQRHTESVHLSSKNFWCPIPGCGRSLTPPGELKPFPRKDKRKDHFHKVHKDAQADLTTFDDYVANLVQPVQTDDVTTQSTGFASVSIPKEQIIGSAGYVNNGPPYNIPAHDVSDHGLQQPSPALGYYATNPLLITYPIFSIPQHPNTLLAVTCSLMNTQRTLYKPKELQRSVSALQRMDGIFSSLTIQSLDSKEHMLMVS